MFLPFPKQRPSKRLRPIPGFCALSYSFLKNQLAQVARDRHFTAKVLFERRLEFSTYDVHTVMLDALDEYRSSND